MVNETLQDIFDEFYTRQAKIEEDYEKRHLIEENDQLQEEICNLEDIIYEKDDIIDGMNYEINKAKNAYEDLAEFLSHLKKTIEILEVGRLKDLEWHIRHAEHDW